MPVSERHHPHQFSLFLPLLRPPLLPLVLYAPRALVPLAALCCPLLGLCFDRFFEEGGGRGKEGWFFYRKLDGREDLRKEGRVGG
jgi:hypothetical protein